MGILQITRFTENPRGVKIRYKLVQADKTAAPHCHKTSRRDLSSQSTVYFKPVHLKLCSASTVGMVCRSRRRTTTLVAGFFDPSYAPTGPNYYYSPVSIPKQMNFAGLDGNRFTRDGITYRPICLKLVS